MIKLLISENEPGQAEELASKLGAIQEIEVVGYARDGLEVAQMVAQLSPDVALIHADLPGINGLDATQMAVMASPETACVVLTGNGTEGEKALQQAMQAGARAVLPVATSAETLENTVRQVAKLKECQNWPEYELVTNPAKMPMTVAVTGAKGGIGKTTIATNLAVSLQQQYAGEVVLEDFIGQYGDVSLMLDLPQDGGLAELAAYEELELDLVESYLKTHSCGLKVLSAPQHGGNGNTTTITTAYLANLLGVLRRAYRFIVFDIPPLIEPLSSYVLSRSNVVIVVTYLLDLAAIRGTAALLDSLVEKKLPTERIKLVVNRADSRSPFSIADLRQATKWTPSAQIPEDVATVGGAVNEGIPVILGAPNSAIARSINKLAEAIIAELPGRTGV